jgi:predicted acylesterase/phospholipase RssA
MMHSLAKHGITADMVVGSSVGAINGAYYAGNPTLKGVLQLEHIWRGLQRHDVFPITWRTLLGFVWRRDFLIPHDGIRKLIHDHIPYRNLEEAKVPVHIVATDIISGDSVVLSKGSVAEAIVASTAIPGAFSPVYYHDHYLSDGAVSSNTPIKIAVKLGARRLIILPTGHACANEKPPVGAVANALHALTLLRAAIGDRAGEPRSRHRVLCGAAAMPAGGITLRFFAHRGSYRARHREYRCLAFAERPRAKRHSPRAAPTPSLTPQLTLQCNKAASRPMAQPCNRLIYRRGIR